MTEDRKDRPMPFLDHLEELRSRLMRSLWVFTIGFLVSYWKLTEPVLGILRAPLFKILPPEQQKLYFTHLFENFMVHLKISAICSLFIFSPFFFYQIWAFIAPGLYPRERKWVVPFVSAATFFFFAGAAFAYFVLFPTAFKFFITYGTTTDVPLLTIGGYYTTCLKLLLLFGLAFELPVLIILLGALGVVQSESLRKQRKTAIVGISIGSALFAPPDAISMIILMIPLILLYEFAIVVVSWIEKGRPPSPLDLDENTKIEPHP